MDKSLLWFVPAVIVALGIFVLSTFLALPIQIKGVEAIDKWEHTFAYLILSLSLLTAFRKTEKLNPHRSSFILLFCIVYGIVLELVQYYFFQHRYFEWADALANVVGATLGFFIFGFLNRKKRD